MTAITCLSSVVSHENARIAVLVTALNLDVGRWMWWPSKLARTPDPARAQLSLERAGALAAAVPAPPVGAGGSPERWQVR